MSLLAARAANRTNLVYANISDVLYLTCSVGIGTKFSFLLYALTGASLTIPSSVANLHHLTVREKAVLSKGVVHEVLISVYVSKSGLNNTKLS